MAKYLFMIVEGNRGEIRIYEEPRTIQNDNDAIQTAKAWQATVTVEDGEKKETLYTPTCGNEQKEVRP